LAKKRKGPEKDEVVPAAVFGWARRMVVTYVDGSWTDNLAIERYGLHTGPDGLSLTIDVAPRERVGKVRVARQALRDFVSRRRKIHTIQIGKPKFSTQLRLRVTQFESPVIGVKLSANGHAVTYPAGIVFGPDATTLNLG
jgi:hypothetical protein